MVGADAELTQLPRFHRSVNPGVGINTTILLNRERPDCSGRFLKCSTWNIVIFSVESAGATLSNRYPYP